MFRALAFIGSFALIGLLATSAWGGRRIEDWPYERLFKEADLAVIATADGTADTKDQLKHKEWAGVEFVGQESTLKVQSILKGSLKEEKGKGEKTIKVLHYRLPENRKLENGPMLVTFRKEGLNLEGTINGVKFQSSEGKPDYMIFLRSRPDGRYEPISGQIDPALSVRIMTSPSDFLEELGTKKVK
jgi:hypothetical protein